MMELIHRLYRYLAQHQLVAGNIKITIEFLDPETQGRSEFLLRTQAQGSLFDSRMVQAICDGEPWTMYGIKFQVKRFEYPKKEYLPACNCPFCVHMREEAGNHMRAATHAGCRPF